MVQTRLLKVSLDFARVVWTWKVLSNVLNQLVWVLQNLRRQVLLEVVLVYLRKILLNLLKNHLFVFHYILHNLSLL